MEVMDIKILQTQGNCNNISLMLEILFQKETRKSLVRVNLTLALLRK